MTQLDLFEASPLAGAVLDEAWLVQRGNAAWNTLLGHTIGTRWLDVINSDDLAKELARIGAFQDGRCDVLRMQLRLRLQDESWQQHTVILSRVVPVENNISSSLSSSLSSSMSKTLVTILDRTSVPMVARPSDDNNVLAAALSHDVRQHARLAAAYCSLLARSQLDQRQLTHLNVVADHAERLQQLLGVLVRWLRLRDEMLAVQTCDLNIMWQAATQDLRADLEPADLPKVQGDPNMLGEMLREIARNAVCFHPGRARMRCSAALVEGTWIISVMDNGNGIPTAERERVLKPMLRLHRWEEVQGYGMGLAIAERIALRHGGTLTIHEAPTGGCMVQVRLPA